MADPTVVAAWLLVAGPVLGMIPVAHPALIPVWSAPRERHLAIVGEHQRAWWALNVGFAAATIATTAGLVILGVAGLAGAPFGDAAGDAAGDPVRGALILTAAIAYAVGGGLWCAVLAIRSLVTPELAEHVGTGRPTEPAEALLGAAQQGLFAGFVLATAVALALLGITLLAAGGIAWPVAATCAATGVAAGAWLAITGDVIPATLYVPTLLLGVALLAGWP